MPTRTSSGVIVFDRHLHDWIVLQTFNSEAEAKKFVDAYPRFGAEHSRTIREGNSQITTNQNTES